MPLIIMCRMIKMRFSSYKIVVTRKFSKLLLAKELSAERYTVLKHRYQFY